MNVQDLFLPQIPGRTDTKLRALIFGVLAFVVATSAHAIAWDDPPPDPTEAIASPSPASAAVGYAVIYGTHNTKQSAVVLDATTSVLCNVSFTNCRYAYGLEPLTRSKQLQVAQLVKWDRSGMFGYNATELIACFLYYDAPGAVAYTGAAYFSCQTAQRGPDDSTLPADFTALAWRAYGAAGLSPLSANRVNAFYAKRKTMTAYALANASLPPSRMKALLYEEDTVPDGGGGDYCCADPAPSDIDLETVEITGKKPAPIPLPSSVTTLTSVDFIPNFGQPRDPLIIVDPCVTFQVCSAPPPPKPPAPPEQPKKVCSADCNAQGAVMTATCNSTALELSAAFAILAPSAGIVFGIGTADPAFGWLVFRSVGVVGGATSAGYAATCLGLNAGYQQTCLIKARQAGC